MGQFPSVTTLHGFNDAANGSSRWWRLFATIALLAAFAGLLFEGLNRTTTYMAHPLQTTVSPFYPDRFPILSYCPSDVYYRRIEEVINVEQIFGSKVAVESLFEGESKKMAKNMACGFLDSFFPFGQLFWIIRFSDLGIVKNGNMDIDDYPELWGMLADAAGNIFNRHMKSNNVTYQEMVEQYSLPTYRVLESSDDVKVTKFISLRGVCYIVKRNNVLGSALQRFTGYTVSVKSQDKLEVCVSNPKYDTVAIGQNARVGIPRGANYVSFPGDYVYTLTPRRFSVLSLLKDIT